MPPLPPVPGTVKVAINGTSGSTFRWANILHCGYGGSPPTLGEAQAIAAKVRLSWAGFMSPMQADNVIMDEVVVTDLASVTGAVGIDVSSTTGTRGTTELPASAAALVDYPVLTRYRGGHPRTYLYAGIQTDLVDSGHWASAFVTALQAAWRSTLGAFLNQSYGACNLGEISMVSYVSKFVNPIPPYRRPVPTVLVLDHTTAIAMAEIASQRRRIGRK